ncbi:hypothetical protein FB451DRAFT_1289566 [Mycena latifolia]|nr:hypothetical protein FB451DRAFT_1289566 [Mycena latifolia]
MSFPTHINMACPRSLPPAPQTQALSSLTFKPPPLDGSLSIGQIYDWHFQNTSNHRLFVYARQDGTIRTIFWPEAIHAVYVGAQILRDRFSWVAGKAETPVVSILAASDAIPYGILLMSCFRANYVVFPISPRNSPAAVAHLIDKAGVNHLLIGHDSSMLELANGALEILASKYPSRKAPDVSYVPLFEELFLPASERKMTPDSVPYEYKGPDACIIIMHSSGSTAFPKPIYWSNHRIIQATTIPFFGERDLANQVVSLHSMPMYHGMGVLQTIWSASCGLVLSGFEPKAIPTIPTPETLFHAAKASESDIIFCVPSFIEAWSREPEYVKWLATRGGVLYGGGPLNKAAGDYMTSQGVSIFILYGCSEGGIMSPLLPADVGSDWEYFKFPDLVTPEMVPYGDNTFELIMVDNVFGTPVVLNTKVRGINAYATSDLLVPHPTKPGYWKIFGRTDDQIMHNTGEKTNPGPLESILNQDPHVLSSVMFGRGRFQAGILVDPKPAFKLDPSDPDKLAEFRNKIWPTVIKMNNFAPQHSRLFKEMILVVKPDKPFTYTAKMSVRRQAVIADYEDEMAALYDTVEQTAELNIPPLLDCSAASILVFVRDAVHNIVTARLGDDDDIFQHGCDSLQATWLRNALLRALRDAAQLDARANTGNFVYEHPTIARLARFIFAMASGAQDEDVSGASKSSVMRALVEKYTKDFPRHAGTQPPRGASEKVVLITGTTGELGCYLVAHLLADDSVVQVYALNRSSTQQQALRERQSLALVDRGLNASILDSPKLSLLEGDLANPDFGLPVSIFQTMQRSVTHIIHNAWPVDFNLALGSFETNIKGLRKLVDFSLGSSFIEPPTLLYTSSIGILQNAATKAPLAEVPVDVEIAAGNGYQESKWIVEEILAKAAASTRAKPLVVRVGQLCGGINGAWNAHEWVPAVVQSAKLTGCLPDDSRDVSWIPVHIAAAALVDFLEEAPAANILHLINPQPTAWSTLAKIIAVEFDVPLVPYPDWLSRIEDAPQTRENLKSFRALRLLPFFRRAANRQIRTEDSEDAFGFPKLDMAHALGSSKTLRSPDCQLREGDVANWMRYWRSIEFL